MASRSQDVPGLTFRWTAGDAAQEFSLRQRRGKKQSLTPQPPVKTGSAAGSPASRGAVESKQNSEISAGAGDWLRRGRGHRLSTNKKIIIIDWSVKGSRTLPLLFAPVGKAGVGCPRDWRKFLAERRVWEMDSPAQRPNHIK